MFLRLIRRFHEDRSGQAMVEAAIILPLFITTCAMTLELCYLASVKSVVNFAAYSACRAGIVHNADGDWMETAAAMALGPITQSKLFRYIDEDIMYPFNDVDPSKDDLGIGFEDRIVKFAFQTMVAKLQFTRPMTWFEFSDYVLAALPGWASSLDPSNFDFSWDGITSWLTTLTTGPTQIAINEFQFFDPVSGDMLYTQPWDLDPWIYHFSPLGATVRGEFPPKAHAGWKWTSGLSSLSRSDMVDSWGGLKPALSGILTGEGPLLTEGGDKKPGIDYKQTTHYPALRLRIRVLHRHKLIFPFLKTVYQAILGAQREAGLAEAKSGPDLLEDYAIIDIVSSTVMMHMQSHLTFGE